MTVLLALWVWLTATVEVPGPSSPDPSSLPSHRLRKAQFVVGGRHYRDPHTAVTAAVAHQLRATMAIAEVQSIGATTSSGTLTLTLGSNPTANNLIVVCVGAVAGNFTPSSTADSYTTANIGDGYAFSANNVYGTVYLTKTSGGASAKTITVDINSDYAVGWATEFSGTAATNLTAATIAQAVDINGVNSIASSFTPGSITPQVSGELFVAFALDSASSGQVTPTLPSGFSTLTAETVAAEVTGLACYLVNSGSGAENPTFGGSSPKNPAAIMIAIFPSGESAPDAPTSPAATFHSAGPDITTSATSGGGGPVSSYTLRRSTTSGSEAAYATDLVSLSYTDSSITEGNTYYYKWEALGPGGTATSTEVSALDPNLAGSGSVLGSFLASGTGVTKLTASGGVAGSFLASGTGSAFFPGSGSVAGSFLASGTASLAVTGLLSGSFLASGTGVTKMPASGSLVGSFTGSGFPKLIGTGTIVVTFSGSAIPKLPASGLLVGSFLASGTSASLQLPPVAPVAPNWQDVYLWTDQWPASKLSVYTAEGEWIVDLEFTEATVIRDETQQVRGQLSATIPSQGLPVAQNPNVGDDLVPVNAGDLLHPVTCNEVRAYRGWVFPNGAELWFPWGVFRMSKPDVPDTGDSILIALTGLDRSSVISRQTWTEPYAIAAGTNLGTAVMGVLNNRWPAALLPLEFDFAPTTITVPATVLGADVSSEVNDPYADALTLATNAGMELFFDVNGIVVMRPVPIPTAAPVVWTFTEDKDCTLVAPVGRVLDETTTYNGVLAVGNGVSGAPVSVVIWDTDPESRTYYLGKWGQTPYPLVTSLVPAPGQSTAEAEDQLAAMATAQLQLVLGAFDSTSFEAVPLPAIVEGDGIGLIKARIGIDAEYVVSRIEMPLDFSTPMTVTNRPRRQAGAQE